jgi:hypothetical protein
MQAPSVNLPQMRDRIELRFAISSGCLKRALV